MSVCWFDSARTTLISDSRLSKDSLCYLGTVLRHSSTVYAAGQVTNRLATSTNRRISSQTTPRDKSRTGIISRGENCLICLINWRWLSAITFQLVSIQSTISALYITDICSVNEPNSVYLSVWLIVVSILTDAFQHFPPSTKDATSKPVRSKVFNWTGS